jgi:hypothetical protein
MRIPLIRQFPAFVLLTAGLAAAGLSAATQQPGMASGQAFFASLNSPTPTAVCSPTPSPFFTSLPTASFTISPTPSPSFTRSPIPTAVPYVASAALTGTAAGLTGAAALSGVAAALGGSPTPTPGPTVNLPQAPGQPTGTFFILTRTGKVPSAAVHLEWEAAEPGDYLIQAYHVYRSSASMGNWELRSDASPADPTALDLDDTVPLGADLDYTVAAVDSKGREGARSAPVNVDLRYVQGKKLAPPAPSGLTATSRRYDVKLHWGKAVDWIAPWSAFRIYRATSLAALPKSLLESVTTTGQDPIALALALSQTAMATALATLSPSLTATDVAASALTITATPTLTPTPKPTDPDFYYYDSPPAQAVDYLYGLTSLDVNGHESPLSVTVSGRATGTVAPGQPQSLSANAKVERVALEWKPSAVGTAPISGYILHRRNADTDHWRKIALLGVSETSFSDGLSGGQGYVYRLAAFDTEGNTGAAAYVAATPTAKELNNTLVILMPTAYANNKGRDTGFNLNVLFDFYVGSLFESHTSAATQRTSSSIFQQLEIGTMTGDFKYAFLNDRGLVPGFALGLYTSALIGFGSGSETVGISSESGGIATLGDVYAVVSKHFIPSVPQAAVHFGLMMGRLNEDVSSSPVPPSLWPTLQHLAPGGDFPSLLSHFVDPSLDQAVGQSPDLAWFGLQFPFTVPLGFTRWRSGLRLEAMVPMDWNAEWAQNVQDTATETGSPASHLPYIINIHIDNLPLFGFEFGLFEFYGGYEVIAFYHIPDLTWSW